MKKTTMTVDQQIELLRKSKGVESLVVHGQMRPDGAVQLPADPVASLAGVGFGLAEAKSEPPMAVGSPAEIMPWSFTIGVPTVIRSEMNRRDHWAARKRRFDEQALSLGMVLALSPFEPDRISRCMVTLTHIGRKMDGDNLQGGFKAIRDQLAKLIGIDDGDSRINWEYAQRKGPPGVEIRIENRK